MKKNPFNAFLQQLLVKQGYAITVDGIAGTKTRDALKAFQRRAGLPVTGTATAATLAALRRPGAAVPMPRPRPETFQPPPAPMPEAPSDLAPPAAAAPSLQDALAAKAGAMGNAIDAGLVPRPSVDMPPGAPAGAGAPPPPAPPLGVAAGGNSPLADPAVRSYMPPDVRGPNVPDFGAAGALPAYPLNLNAPPPLVSTMSPAGQAAYARGVSSAVNDRDAQMRALQEALNAKAAAAGAAMGDPAQREALIRALMSNPTRAGY